MMRRTRMRLLDLGASTTSEKGGLIRPTDTRGKVRNIEWFRDAQEENKVIAEDRARRKWGAELWKRLQSDEGLAGKTDEVTGAYIPNPIMIHPDGRGYGEPDDDPKKGYVPPLRREWKDAPTNLLATSTSRADWFRFMQYNIMADSYTPDPKTGHTTTPITDVDVKIPAFLRKSTLLPSADGDKQVEEESAMFTQEEDDPNAVVSYSPKFDKDLPPFLDFEFRMKHFMNEVRHYDPDIICVNELNKMHFMKTMWKAIRYEGYGGLYVSSRGARVKTLKAIDRVGAKIHAGKVDPHEDIGNAVFFHRSRFVPMMLPGPETPRHLYYAHFNALRDTITNMEVFLMCLQLTPGNTKEAVKLREHELKSALIILDSILMHNSSRSHGSVIVCGDLNNMVDDEPCVTILRERLYSAYDVVGGPAWTAWYHQHTDAPNKYYPGKLQAMRDNDGTHKSQQRTTATEMPDHMRKLAMGPTKSKQYETSAAIEAKKAELAEAKLREPVIPPIDNGKPIVDALVQHKAIELSKGIVHRTQDFIFYDPGRCGLIRVLDVPDDSQVDQNTLFPNRVNPSHHIPLIADFAFHESTPDVLLDSLKP